MAAHRRAKGGCRDECDSGGTFRALRVLRRDRARSFRDSLSAVGLPGLPGARRRGSARTAGTVRLLPGAWGATPHQADLQQLRRKRSPDRPETARDLFPLRRRRSGPPERAQAVLPRLPRRRGGARCWRPFAPLALSLSLRLRPCDTQLPYDGRKQFTAGAQAGYLDVRRQDPRHLVLQADEQHARPG